MYEKQILVLESYALDLAIGSAEFKHHKGEVIEALNKQKVIKEAKMAEIEEDVDMEMAEIDEGLK